MQSPDVICVSNSENEEKEERYLKIFYEDCLMFIEIPLSDDGTLLLADIKSIEPNIAALNLTKGDEYKRLLKSKNGCLKEPPEKWNSFKVFAVLSDSTTVKNMSTVKMDVDRLYLPSVSNVAPEAAGSKQETCHQQADEYGPSTSVQLMNVSENINESVPPENGIVADEMQLQNSLNDIVTKQIKKEACDSFMESADNELQSTSGSPPEATVTIVSNQSLPQFRYIDLSLPQSSTRQQSTSSNLQQRKEPYLLPDGSIFVWQKRTTITRDEWIKQRQQALTIPNHPLALHRAQVEERRRLKAQRERENGRFHLQHFASVQSNASVNMEESVPSSSNVAREMQLRYFPRKSRTIQIVKEACDSSSEFDDDEDMESIDGSSSDDTETKARKKVALPYPQHIDKSLPTTSGQQHQSTSIISRNIKKSAAALSKKQKNRFAFFTSMFLSSKRKLTQFNSLKRNLSCRITKARLKLPFEDPLLIEKLMFLKTNARLHPNLKDIFAAANFLCSNCKTKKKFYQIFEFFRHMFTKKHLRLSLTQDELNKLLQAVSYIDYSDNGLFYKSVSNLIVEPRATGIIQGTLSSPQHIDESGPSNSVQPLNASERMNELVPPENGIVADENQLRILSCGPQNRQMKKEAYDSSLGSADNEKTVSTSASSSRDDNETKEIKKESVQTPQHIDHSLPSTYGQQQSTSIVENVNESTTVSLLLKKNNRDPYAFFVDAFHMSRTKFSKFEAMKRILLRRVTEAKLKLPFDDPLLIEKLVFLKKSVHRHPTLKNIFPETFLCIKCRAKNSERTSSNVVCHIMGQKHLRKSLTQDELNKLIEAVSFIDYSDNGFFYKSPLKRNALVSVQQRNVSVNMNESLSSPDTTTPNGTDGNEMPRKGRTRQIRNEVLPYPPQRIDKSLPSASEQPAESNPPLRRSQRLLDRQNNL